MEDGSDDVFVTHHTAEEAPQEEPQEARPLEDARETEAETLEHAKGLIPLCAQHLHGPQLSSAVFGYDIAQMVKRPWAEPGAKLSDYFNYGFNEESWRVYCAMQKDGEDALLAKATEMLQKLETTARPTANGVGPAVGAEETGAGGRMPEDPSMLVMMPGMENGGGAYGPGPYGGGEGPMGGRYGGPGPYGRPFHPRDFHGGPPGAHNANYKTRLCKAFAEGHCHRGETCNYAHGPADLRQPGGAPLNAGAAGPNAPPMPPPPHMNGPGGYGGNPMNFYGEAPGAAAPQAPPPPPPPPPQPASMPERSANYLMPPFQAGAALPPMMQQGTMAPPRDSADNSGFRQPPKRQRHEGGGNVYEPQY